MSLRHLGMVFVTFGFISTSAFANSAKRLEVSKVNGTYEHPRVIINHGIALPANEEAASVFTSLSEDYRGFCDVVSYSADKGGSQGSGSTITMVYKIENCEK